jgi:hypothetical protein
VQVRYESRKKLAEVRPRVQGQFVRQESLPLATPLAGLLATPESAGNKGLV